MGDFDDAVSTRELVRAIRECRRGQGHKDGPVKYAYTALGSAARLRRDILSGRYHARKGKVVQIYRPKRREATAPWFRDRVWQQSMSNNGVYRDLTEGFIYENLACQKGKGPDIGIRLTIAFLQDLYWSDPSAPIHVDHTDIRKFFPSTSQKIVHDLDRRRIKDKRYLPSLDEIVDMQDDPRSDEEIAADPFGKRGTGLGSRINQSHQVALLDELDHKVKALTPYYIRYNDDFLFMSHDKEVVVKVRKLICSTLADLGLTMTDKQGICTAEHGFYFLRKRFIVTKTGKIIIRLHPRVMADERKVLRKFKEMIDSGERTIEDLQRHYQSWVANADYAGDAPITKMDIFYRHTFGVRPKYKRKKRYLYGTKGNNTRALQKVGEGKQAA